MAFREDYQKRIDRKRQEIEDLRKQVQLEERYLQAMLDTFKMLPREPVVAANEAPSGPALRKNSLPALAYVALKRVGAPMHVKALLTEIGKPTTRNNYSTLSSSLTAYARRGEIFTKPEPNTFGLIEFGEAARVADLISVSDGEVTEPLLLKRA